MPLTDEHFVHLVRELSSKVDQQAAILAVLVDRKGDTKEAVDMLNGRIDRLRDRVTVLETEAAGARGRMAVITSLVAAGAGAAGAGGMKLLGMLGH